MLGKSGHLKGMPLLILMRHGQSLWNAANLFTGWVDVPLTDKGIEEAIQGGKGIAHLPIDEVHTSTLIRAQMTAMLALSQHEEGKNPVIYHNNDGSERGDWNQPRGEVESILPVHVAWQLNERMYGDLQGLNHQVIRDKYGDEQVHIWRRSFDISPPGGESLQMTAARTIPYLDKAIIPSLNEGKNIFVSAHGNSLRSIIMSIEDLSREEILKLEVPTGIPLIYEYDNGTFVRK
jgi:2,3-bisphosphoglycerate-dependent phosphoglycerate mutase|tara:strand:+ start:472 stop:1173 length:702 start_codon:yes stop_codon:yes gene_type:complete